MGEFHFKTVRLGFRNYVHEDEDFFVELNICPVVRKHVDGPMLKEDVHALFRDIVLKNPYAYAICLNHDQNELVGHLWLNEGKPLPYPEVGYIFQREHWNLGYASEALGGLIEFHRSRLEGLFATCDKDHHASLKVLKKHGFKILREVLDDPPEYYELALEF